MRTNPRGFSSLDVMMEDLTEFLAKPQSFANFSEDLEAWSLDGMKKMFNFYQKFARGSLQRLEARGGCKPVGTGPLTELYTEGLDDDQIWEQIQLVNEPVINGLTPVAANLASMLSAGGFKLLRNNPHLGKKEKTKPPRSKLGTNCEASLCENGDKADMDSDLRISEEEEEVKKKVRVGGRKSIVDDKFFKLSEMEKFLEMVEKEDEGQGRSKYVGRVDLCIATWMHLVANTTA